MIATNNNEYRIKLKTAHPKQAQFVYSKKPRIIIRAGRRSGKTTGIAIRAIERFLKGRRVLYATPTQDQIGRFWSEITRALAEPIAGGVFRKNETHHTIEWPGTDQRIKAKTAFNADTLRGDYCDDLILDEAQMMSEDTWYIVALPMLLDNNGDACLIYTPPTLRNQSRSKARDPMWVAKLFKKARQDVTGRWTAFHFSSRENPHISAEALSELAHDMSALAIRQEIDAEDIEEAPGALWKRAALDALRVERAPELRRIVIAVDPAATSTGDEAGIVGAGLGIDGHGYILSDASLQGSPYEWSAVAVEQYHQWQADSLVAESNQGGEMVSLTIKTVPNAPPVRLIHATRGKLLRAEPIATLSEQGKIHLVGEFPKLEAEMTQWVPGGPSPNRLDAAIYALSDLMLRSTDTYRTLSLRNL